MSLAKIKKASALSCLTVSIVSIILLKIYLSILPWINTTKDDRAEVLFLVLIALIAVAYAIIEYLEVKKGQISFSDGVHNKTVTFYCPHCREQIFLDQIRPNSFITCPGCQKYLRING